MDVLYDTKGKAQSLFMFFHLESYPEIKQFQIIQDNKREYTLKLNTYKEFHYDKELIDLYAYYLGSDANIKIEYVNEIPQLSSGKRRLTVNNYILDKNFQW